MAAKNFECPSGKIPHETREAAEAHARSIQQKDGHLPHIFTCKECGFLHIGGGRKSDRPAWLQTHSGPVLPPGKLPRKSYERRQVDKGESVSVEDALRNILQSPKHVFISDTEIADRLQMNWWVVRGLRVELGIPNREKRLDEVVLAALQKNPGLHRGNLAKELGCSEGAILDRVAKFGFARTGRPGTFGRGPKATQWGRKHSAESRAKIRAANKRQFASSEARAAAAARQSAWAKAHPDAVRANIKDARKAMPNGHRLHLLAGKPTKDAVIAVFGRTGYRDMSWFTRAKRLGISAEELCQKFRNDPNEVKKTWEGREAKKAVTNH